MIDTSTEFGQRAQRRLESETTGWLTTVSPTGQPQSIPIWFLWQPDGSLLMYSQPNALKLRNLRNNPRASFNLNSDAHGNDIVRLEGSVEIGGLPPITEVPAYIEKYRRGIASLNMTPESFSEEYSVPLLMRRPRLRGF